MNNPPAVNPPISTHFYHRLPQMPKKQGSTTSHTKPESWYNVLNKPNLPDVQSLYTLGKVLGKG